VPPLGIVEALDIVEHVGPGIVPRPIRLARCALGLQRGEEALHRRIVPAIARAAHRAGDAMIGHQPLELLAGVLAATIRVVQQRAGFSTAPDRHHQGVGDELSCHGRAHRPADHAPGEQIDDRCHIKPALRRPDVGEVGDPFAVRSRGLEAAIQHVGSYGARLPLTQIGRQPTPSGTRFKALLAHQTLDPMQPAGHPLSDQVMPHTPGAVGPITGEEAGPHLRGQVFVAAAAPAAGPHQPGIEAATRDPERPAHPSRRPYGSVLRNEGELHVLSFAK
jgi:hypothetical protein